MSDRVFLFRRLKLFNTILDFFDRKAWPSLINAFMNREIEFDFNFEDFNAKKCV